MYIILQAIALKIMYVCSYTEVRFRVKMFDSHERRLEEKISPRKSDKSDLFKGKNSEKCLKNGENQNCTPSDKIVWLSARSRRQSLRIS